jgi:hypothetical protein
MLRTSMEKMATYIGTKFGDDAAQEWISGKKIVLSEPTYSQVSVGQVLRAENVPPHIAAKFYKAVVQAVLLYGSETWVLSTTALASLEGFHIRAAYRMAVKHKPRRGPGHRWIFPKLKDLLEECVGLHGRM